MSFTEEGVTTCLTFIDKSAWIDGPWKSEPDKIYWKDAETGYDCLAVRNPQYGHWCGYVGIKEGHPAYGKHHEEVDDNISVHGGITFGDFYQEEDKEHGICHLVSDDDKDDKVYWLGFDCAHGFDILPKYEDYLRSLVSSVKTTYTCKITEFEKAVYDRISYKDLEFVKNEILSLARKLKEMENE
ncbi:MAG TPA: hypothetical protein VGK47_04515 [Nitrososphaeraceae archaeon]